MKLKPLSVEGLFLADFEGILKEEEVSASMEKEGLVPAMKSDAVKVRLEIAQAQRENPVVVMGEVTEENGEKRILVYPVVGEGVVQASQYIAQDVLSRGKWEKHARFLVTKI